MCSNTQLYFLFYVKWGSPKLYEKNGQLYKSLDITAGEVVKVRNYYNNTTTSSVTAANITDSIPANFTRVGNVTNNYVDAAPVTLNNNVFTGQNLSVAPGAGYFGYATDSSLTSSNLELGKFRYVVRRDSSPATNPGAYNNDKVWGLYFQNDPTLNCSSNWGCPSGTLADSRYLYTSTYSYTGDPYIWNLSMVKSMPAAHDAQTNQKILDLLGNSPFATNSPCS